MVVGVVVKSETSALTTCIGWQQRFDCLYNPAACGFVGVENQSVKRPSDPIFVEIPLGFAHKIGRMRRLAIEGMGSLTFDTDLVRQGKVGVAVDLAERLYFLRRSRHLISEII